jgi:hypothetical protein
VDFVDTPNRHAHRIQVLQLNDVRIGATDDEWVDPVPGVVPGISEQGRRGAERLRS